jgi:hypothetical protein
MQIAAMRRIMDKGFEPALQVPAASQPIRSHHQLEWSEADLLQHDAPTGAAADTRHGLLTSMVAMALVLLSAGAPPRVRRAPA